jgi:DNA-directed RNA polymerase subunit RPC12/RpoP
MNELHEYVSFGDYQRRPAGLCSTCGQPYDTDVHHVVAEGWCQWDQEDHDYQMGALECSRCGAEAPAEDMDMCEGCGSLFEEDELNEDGYCEGCRS